MCLTVPPPSSPCKTQTALAYIHVAPNLFQHQKIINTLVGLL